MWAKSVNKSSLLRFRLVTKSCKSDCRSYEFMHKERPAWNLTEYSTVTHSHKNEKKRETLKREPLRQLDSASVKPTFITSFEQVKKGYGIPGREGAGVKRARLEGKCQRKLIEFSFTDSGIIFEEAEKFNQNMVQNMRRRMRLQAMTVRTTNRRTTMNQTHQVRVARERTTLSRGYLTFQDCVGVQDIQQLTLRTDMVMRLHTCW